MVYLLIALAMGLFIPVQTAANSRLRQSVGSAQVSTLISFTVSTLSLLLVALMVSAPVIPSSEAIHTAPWWTWFGGIIALLTITIAICLFKEIGQLQAMIIPMFAQLLFSLCIDHFGWFGSNVIPMNLQRLLGAVLLIIGVILIVVIPRLKEKGNRQERQGARQVLWQLCAIVSGCLMATIGAIYATLGSILGSAVQASTISFVIATTAMAVYCLCSGNIGQVKLAFTSKAPWWMWLGGICGATTVYGNAWLIPKIGVGVFVTAILVGQLILSLLMEHNGWLGAPKKPIKFIQISGIIIMLIGVILIKL